MAYWTAIQILTQLAGEIGLPRPTTIVSSTDVQSVQLLSALNSAGNDLVTLYPWEQFGKEWVFDTVQDQGSYDLPADWSYARDMTQWDRTNHWPLLGPKSPQEWAWLKGGLMATAPRMRFRVLDNKLQLWPVPAAGVDLSFSPYELAIEYIRSTWVQPAVGDPQEMVTLDGDTCLFNPWLLIKYTKVKWYQLKQFDSAKVEGDFASLFNRLTGKDVGAGVLSLAPGMPPQFLGPWNIPDGSWQTGAP